MDSGWALFLVSLLGFAMFFYLTSNWTAAFERKRFYFGDGIDGSISTENSIREAVKRITREQHRDAYERFNQSYR